jgi:hypothetical protein
MVSCPLLGAQGWHPSFRIHQSYPGFSWYHCTVTVKAGGLPWVIGWGIAKNERGALLRAASSIDLDKEDTRAILRLAGVNVDAVRITEAYQPSLSFNNFERRLA